VPLSSLATGNIEKENAESASSLFNMMRNLGGSIGIALLATLLTRCEQFHSNRQGEFVTIYNPSVKQRLDQTTKALVSRGMPPTTATMQAVKVLDNSVRREAFVMGYNDCFFIVGLLLLISGFSALLCKKVKPGAGGAAH
jgi:MFS transporter, DHA2 family, multidrug resistance protein